MSRNIILAANKKEAEHAARMMRWPNDKWTNVVDESTLCHLRPGTVVFTYGNWWAHPDANSIEAIIDAREICCVAIA